MRVFDVFAHHFSCTTCYIVVASPVSPYLRALNFHSTRMVSCKKVRWHGCMEKEVSKTAAIVISGKIRRRALRQLPLGWSGANSPKSATCWMTSSLIKADSAAAPCYDAVTSPGDFVVVFDNPIRLSVRIRVQLLGRGSQFLLQVKFWSSPCSIAKIELSTQSVLPNLCNYRFLWHFN